MLVKGGAGQKRAFLRRSLRLLMRRVTVRVQSYAPADGSASHTKHCIVLHGWGLDEVGLREMREALRALPACAGRRFWSVRYDTQWTDFETSAALIAAELARQPCDFDDVIFVGYSMGGIVARRLMANGFNCRALLAICTPHHGPLRWLNFPGPGSLAQGKPAMQRLNGNARDIAHRNRFHCFAVTYTDRIGFHDHDGVVPRFSALGDKLGRVASRHTTHLTYGTIATYDPHWRGKLPKFMPKVLRVMSLIEQGEAAPLATTDEIMVDAATATTANAPVAAAPLPPVPAGTEPGDLLLFMRARGLNRLITFFTHSRYYHVALFEGGSTVIEARPRGVVRRDLNGPDGDRPFVVAKALGALQAAALDWARQRLGDRYDPLDVLVIVLERVFRSLQINYQAKCRFSCAEFVTLAYRAAGTELFPGRAANDIVPADFAIFLNDAFARGITRPPVA